MAKKKNPGCQRCNLIKKRKSQRGQYKATVRARGFFAWLGLKMCRPSVNTKNSCCMREKPLVPWAKEKLFLSEQRGYPVPAQVAYQIKGFPSSCATRKVKQSYN